MRGAPPGREAEFTELGSASARLLRAALVLLDSREEAEDALQLTLLLRTFRRWDHARQAPEAYSRTVLVNVCREHWRHRARHPEVPGAFTDTGPLAVVTSFAEAADRRHMLVRVLRRLPAVQREVLVFRYMLDATVADTAAALGIPEGTVKSAASRGSTTCGCSCPQNTKTRGFAVSIHADDEFNLRLAMMSELDDVTPRDGLADLVIARYRKSRRRRFAGVFGLFVVFAGIGVPIGVAGTSGRHPGPARAGRAPSRLVHADAARPVPPQLSDARTAPCATGAGAGQETAAVASGVCVLMLFMPPASPSLPGPDVPRHAEQVTVGHYRAWLAPPGYAPALVRTALVRTALVIEGDGRDLVIGASGLSRSALVARLIGPVRGLSLWVTVEIVRLASIHTPTR